MAGQQMRCSKPMRKSLVLNQHTMKICWSTRKWNANLPQDWEIKLYILSSSQNSTKVLLIYLLILIRTPLPKDSTGEMELKAEQAAREIEQVIIFSTNSFNPGGDSHVISSYNIQQTGDENTEMYIVEVDLDLTSNSCNLCTRKCEAVRGKS